MLTVKDYRKIHLQRMIEKKIIEKSLDTIIQTNKISTEKSIKSPFENLWPENVGKENCFIIK